MNKFEKTKRFIMQKKYIGFFKSILESYEDVAIFSVLDGKRGIIELVYPCQFEEEVLAIVEDMSRHGILLEEADNV